MIVRIELLTDADISTMPVAIPVKTTTGGLRL
jgi:hypothetical protein